MSEWTTWFPYSQAPNTWSTTSRRLIDTRPVKLILGKEILKNTSPVCWYPQFPGSRGGCRWALSPATSPSAEVVVFTFYQYIESFTICVRCKKVENVRQWTSSACTHLNPMELRQKTNSKDPYDPYGGSSDAYVWEWIEINLYSYSVGMRSKFDRVKSL